LTLPYCPAAPDGSPGPAGTGPEGSHARRGRDGRRRAWRDTPLLITERLDSPAVGMLTRRAIHFQATKLSPPDQAQRCAVERSGTRIGHDQVSRNNLSALDAGLTVLSRQPQIRRYARPGRVGPVPGAIGCPLGRVGREIGEEGRLDTGGAGRRVAPGWHAVPTAPCGQWLTVTLMRSDGSQMTCFSAGSYSGVEPPACPRNKRRCGSRGAPFGETHCTLAG
jgi:hypothetical protein